MSYSVYIQKFENCDAAPIPYDQLEQILSKYGKIESGHFGLEFVSKIGEMFEDAPLSGNLEDGITGITFNRPILSEQFPLLIFDLLEIENTCFFGSDLEFIHSRNEMTNHFPESLIEDLPDGPKVIFSALEDWPLK